MAGGSVGVSFLCAFLDPATPTPLLDFSSIAGHEISEAATGVSLAASFSYSLELLVSLRLYSVSENNSFCQLFLQELSSPMGSG